MGLHIRRTSSRKAQLIITLFAAFALVTQPLYGMLVSQVTYALTEATQIVFTTAAQAVPFNASTKNKISVQLRDEADKALTLANGATITVTSDSPTATFSNNGTNGWKQPALYPIRQKKSFYYQDSAVGVHHITVTASGDDLASPITATQQITVLGPPATPERVSPGEAAVKGKDGIINDWTDVDDATSYVYQSFTVDSDGNCNMDDPRGDEQTFPNSQTNAVNEVASYCWRVQSKNALGESAWSKAWKVTVDNDAPSIAIDPIGTVGGKTGNLSFVGSITDLSGVKQYSYQVFDAATGDSKGEAKIVDNTSVDKGTIGSWDVTSYDGSYYVKIIATDAAGNVTFSPPEFVFNVDSTAPDSTIKMKNSANFMASTGSISLTGEATGDFSSLKLLRDGDDSTAVDLTQEAKDSNGDWSYIIPKEQVVQGTYNFSIVATDQYDNSTTRALDPIIVSAYIPGGGSALPANPVAPLAPVIIASNPLTSTTRPFTSTPFPTNTDSAVLGAEDTKGTKAQSNDLPVVAATENGWKFFGISWYWWTLVALVVAGGAWWTFSSVRRRAEQLA